MILKNGKRIDSGCSDTVPIGTLNPYVGTIAPFGYLLCKGQKESKATYPELASMCGDLFGPSTATEFYLPDLRGCVIAGYKEGDSLFGTLGGLIGEATHILTASESGLPEHNHLLTNADVMVWVGTYGVQGNQGTTAGTTMWGTAGMAASGKYAYTNNTSKDATTAHNNVQPTVVMNWIVKAFNLLPNSSTVVTSQNDSDSNVYSCNYINALKTAILDSAFPIGKVEVFFDDEDHSDYLGFTWIRELEGLSPVGYKASDSDYSTIGSTLGSKTHSTTYTPAGTNTGAAVTAHTYTPAGTNKNMAVTMNAISLSHSGGAVKSHTLTTSEIPSHSHKVNVCASDIAAAGNGIGRELLGTSTRTQWDTTSTGGGGGHSHDFTQPSAHSFTPTAKSYTQPTFTGTQATLSHTVTQPTFTGTQATISMDTRDPQKVVAYWRRVS